MTQPAPQVLTIFSNLQYAGEYEQHDGWQWIDFGSEQNGELIQLAFLPLDGALFKVRFKAYGCVEIYAAAELLCRNAQDKTYTQLMKIDIIDIVDPLQIPAVKSHLIHLIKGAWRQLLIEVKKHVNAS